MDFQKMLLKIDQGLSREEAETMVFLCKDLLEKDLSTITSASDLFTHLEQQGLLDSEDVFIVPELLFRTRNFSLLKKLKLTKNEVQDLLPRKGKISNYRQLLYDLSENITSADLKSVKFLLQNTLPRILKLFLEMEKQDHLDKNNLETLEQVIQIISPNLIRKIAKYKTEIGRCIRTFKTSFTGFLFLFSKTEEILLLLKSMLQYDNIINTRYNVIFKLGYELTNYKIPSEETGSHNQAEQLSSLDFPIVHQYTHHTPAISGEENRVLKPVHRWVLLAMIETQHLLLHTLALPSAWNRLKSDSSVKRTASTDSTTCITESTDAHAEDLSSRMHRLSSSGDSGISLAYASVSNPRPSFASSSVNTNVESVPGDTVHLEVYEMNGEKRGYCLIINNYSFAESRNATGHDQKPFLDRKGTMVDAQRLTEVFEWLGFVTERIDDCSQQKIVETLQRYQQRNHGAMDCFVCCILSHGLKGVVYGVDGRKILIKEMTRRFSGVMCPSLRGKPKLFFIQACQGTAEQLAAPIEADSYDPDISTDAYVPKNCIPDDSDFLIGMATVEDYASYRDKLQGTWYIQSLCENLQLLVPRGEDLLSILTKVNMDVSKKSDKYGIKKQIPQPAYSLRKKLIFPHRQAPAPLQKLQKQ
ncbi:CASP8 protein, partial [Atractosteus spatula]|nr:CASP8 protein [Atractosteus spatula]